MKEEKGIWIIRETDNSKEVGDYGADYGDSSDNNRHQNYPEHFSKLLENSNIVVLREALGTTILITAVPPSATTTTRDVVNLYFGFRVTCV
jgi:hypothetical protein